MTLSFPSYVSLQTPHSRCPDQPSPSLHPFFLQILSSFVAAILTFTTLKLFLPTDKTLLPLNSHSQTSFVIMPPSCKVKTNHPNWIVSSILPSTPSQTVSKVLSQFQRHTSSNKWHKLNAKGVHSSLEKKGTRVRETSQKGKDDIFDPPFH